MFAKFVEPHSFDHGVAPITLIKDVKSLTKRAAASSLLKYAKTKGQEDLHIIAVGAYEGTGYNRNLDRFMEKWCEKNAHYFRDADRCVHRHHQNKPSSPKYGNVKAAAYNRDMRRIELILGLDIDKCADILHEQEKVGHTNWSMASKQAHDVCTWCKHKAYTDVDRCAHIPDKLGEMNKEGEICGMDNPDPKWFEISYVRRPADRIGMSLQKAAGVLTPLLPRDYLNIYTDFELPGEVIISKTAAEKRELLSKLSEIEKRIEAESLHTKLEGVSRTEKIASHVLDDLRNLNPIEFFKVAADKGIILSPDNFFSYLFADRIKEASLSAIKAALPSIFQLVEKEASEIVNDETFSVAGTPQYQNSTISKLASDLSMFRPYVEARLGKQIKVAEYDKSAELDPMSRELAKQYVNYKLATLQYLNSCDKVDDALLLTVVLQNR